MCVSVFAVVYMCCKAAVPLLSLLLDRCYRLKVERFVCVLSAMVRAAPVQH